MRERAHVTLLLIWPLTAALAGCTVGPNFKPPIAEAPARWSASAAPFPGQASRITTAPPDDADAWWTLFNDPELTSLIRRAAAANLDANAGLQVNRLSESTPTGALFTKVGQSPALKGLGISIPNPYDQYQLGFDASWEVDLFGRVRRSVEAARADTQAQLE